MYPSSGHFPPCRKLDVRNGLPKERNDPPPLASTSLRGSHTTRLRSHSRISLTRLRAFTTFVPAFAYLAPGYELVAGGCVWAGGGNIFVLQEGIFVLLRPGSFACGEAIDNSLLSYSFFSTRNKYRHNYYSEHRQ